MKPRVNPRFALIYNFYYFFSLQNERKKKREKVQGGSLGRIKRIRASSRGRAIQPAAARAKFIMQKNARPLAE